MIDSISIHNFKLFLDVNQRLAPLTLLTGLNGRGKSTLVQAILLAWHSISAREPALVLNNDLVNLGRFADIIPWNREDMKISLTITMNGQEFGLRPTFIPVEVVNEDYALCDALLPDSDFSLPRFQYLSAYRMGNMQAYPTASQALRRNSLSERCGDGLATARFLYEHASSPIAIPALARDTEKSLLLGDQVNAWLKLISPDLNVQSKPAGDGSYQLRYSLAEELLHTPLTANAPNVGYGITYALPILTALLSTPPGGIVMIDTPEAHVHPSGQAGLMDIISLAVAHGVQVILETHSDHIVNGVLRNLKSQILNEKAVSMLFFDRDEETGKALIEPQRISSQGRIIHPSPGFFDQYMIDLDKLL